MNPSVSDSSNLAQMADIFLPVPPEPVASFGLMIVAMTAIFLLLILFIVLSWKWFNNPYEKLKRHLEKGNLSSREALHHLSHLLMSDVINGKVQQNINFQQNNKEIDQLRFQRQAPDINSVFILIDRMKCNDGC